MALIKIVGFYWTVHSVKIRLERSHERESIDDKPYHPDLRVKDKVGHQISIVVTMVDSLFLDVGVIRIQRILNHRVCPSVTYGCVDHRIVKIETNGSKVGCGGFRVRHGV
jgi:hypothetical protein